MVVNEINAISQPDIDLASYFASLLYEPLCLNYCTNMKPIAKAKSVANNIRRVREYRNYTQDYVARKIGISQNAYSKLELGFHKLSLERLFQIADVLEVDCTALLENENGIVQLRIDPIGRPAAR